MERFGKGYAGNPPANYERFFVPMIGSPLARDLVRAAGVETGERVLDVACGTGVVARLAASQVGVTGAVAGLDVNPGMLAIARSVESNGAPIDWREAKAEEMPFPDATFDIVLCQMGLQFMEDKGAALREMRRVLANGGRLAFNLPGPTPRLFAVMKEAFEEYLGNEPARFIDLVFSLHDADEIQRLVMDAGLSEVSVESASKTLRLSAPEEFLWQYARGTPLAASLAAADDECLEALQRDVVAKCRDSVKDGALELEARIVTTTARK